MIEDEAGIRTLLDNFLSPAGYRVAMTGVPAEAVGLVKRERPDLVLCDIAMPGMDGYHVLRALQADPETAGYPVVFLTAHREFTERVQAFRFGVVDYITKPFAREFLLRKIERVLDGLASRPGVATAEAHTSDLLLEDVRRDRRTGVLSVGGDGAAAARIVIQQGAVVEETGVSRDGGAAARFQELDPHHEHIVTHDPGHDPTALPGPVGELPRFDELPDHLRSVLVVDDNPFFLRFLSHLLASSGLKVFEATAGEEALRIALAERPWLILTDVQMPGADGFELCRRVRSHSLIRHTPLIFLSGWDDYKERYHGLEAGADEYLSKQTPIRELLIRIQLIMRRYSDLGQRGRKGPGMEGSIEVVGAPGFLQMCHLGRLTGTCTVRSDAGTVQVRFRDGEIVGAEMGATSGADAVFAFLAWTRGHFEFTPGDPGPGAPLGEGFQQIVLEGCRRLDEAAR